MPWNMFKGILNYNSSFGHTHNYLHPFVHILLEFWEQQTLAGQNWSEKQQKSN